MTHLPDDITIVPEVLPSDWMVNRAILKKQWIDTDTGRLKADAFLRRRNEDGSLKETGLSVDIARMRPVESFAQTFKLCHAVVEIEVGYVRSISLDVVPKTEPPNDPSHAEIVGIPDDDAREEYLAGLMAKQAQFVWQK
jgi:hypothetical protein